MQTLIESTDDKKVKEKLIEKVANLQTSISIGYKKSVKSVNKRQSGEINYSYSGHNIITKETTFGGELSFSNYNLSAEELREQNYVIDVDVNADFPSVVIGLPSLGQFDLSSLVLEVTYKNSNGNSRTEASKWTEASGWLDPKGEKSSYFQFGLIGESDKERIKSPEFIVRIQVISKLNNASFTIEKTTKLTSGERYIDALELLTRVITVDGSDLEYAKLSDASSDLIEAIVVYKKGNININKTIKPYRINGVYSPPNPLSFLVPIDDTPETSQVVYHTVKGKFKRSGAINDGDNGLYDYEWKQLSEE